jgi:hypothetical protein
MDAATPTCPPSSDFLQHLNKIPPPMELRPGQSRFFPAGRFFFSKAE